MVARLETSSAKFELREDAAVAGDESLGYLDVSPQGTLEEEEHSSSQNEETEMSGCSNEHCGMDENGEDAGSTVPVTQMVLDSKPINNK